jgi:ribonuclease HI
VAEYLDERDLNIYTDGSSYSGPRRGGVGMIFVVTGEDGLEVVHDFPTLGFAGATNNMMELQAPIEALRALVRGSAPVAHEGYRKIVIWSDSRYLVDNFHHARYVWPGQKWMTADGNPVLNANQWKELVKLAGKLGDRRVEFEWVKGHKSSAHNKRADKAAKASAKTQAGRQIGPPAKLRRKRGDGMTERGSVVMRGQVEEIYIVTDTLLPQGSNMYRYEVVAPGSPDKGNIDIAYSERDTVLRAGHTYEVRFNDEPKRPRIEELIREMPADGFSADTAEPEPAA